STSTAWPASWTPSGSAASSRPARRHLTSWSPASRKPPFSASARIPDADWRRDLVLLRLAIFAILVGALMPMKAIAQELPTIPDPVPVTVDRATTALLVLDMNDPTCATRPACVDTVPAVAALLARARAEGMAVIHSTGVNATGWLPEVQPLPDEPTVLSGADKFFNTNLEDEIRSRGITTVLVTGTFA